jgi:hypothetical protein
MNPLARIATGLRTSRLRKLQEYRTEVLDRTADIAEREVRGWEHEKRYPWLRLQMLHTAIEGVLPEDYQALERERRGIDMLLLNRAVELKPYADELAADLLADERDVHRSAPIDIVIGLQARLMENAYFTLKLHRYGNAPDNRGWMNLFRSWGRSPTFNARFEEIAFTYAESFVGFYRDYLQHYTMNIDIWPIPHPWDIAGWRMHPTNEALTSLGLFLDSGIGEFGVAHAGERTGADPADDPAPGAHGTPVDTGNDAAAAQAESYLPPPNLDAQSG